MEISQKLHALAKAYAGEKLYDKNIAKYALLTLNNAFKSSIDSGVMSGKYSRDNQGIDDIAEPLGKTDVAENNQKLMLNPIQRSGSGCVYKADKTATNKYLDKLTYKELKGCTGVKINITPICDDTQLKNEFSYFIYGLLAPEDIKTKKGDYIYEFRHYFMYKGKNVRLILNLRALRNNPKSSFNPRVNTQLLSSEITSLPIYNHKISGYNARPSHILLSDK